MGTWIKLEDFKCPVIRCPGFSKDGKKWVCKSHGNAVFLNELGIVRCSTYACEGKVINWRWNCGDSYHNGQYLEADMEGFTFAMSQAIQLLGEAGSKWVAKLIIELGEQYGK